MHFSKYRAIASCTGLLLAMAGAIWWIQSERIEPLVTPPEPPPPGLHLAWAGAPIRGYAVAMTTYVTSCDKPPVLHLMLYPVSGSPKVPPAGRVAFAVSGTSTAQMPRVIPRLSNTLGHPTARAYDIGEYASTAPVDGPAGWRAFAFMFDPRKQRDIELIFRANWLSPRDENSCWLSLPALLGGSEASIGANKAIGHPKWAEEQRGIPLSIATNQLQTEGEMTLVNPANSIPLPSELSNHTWLCNATNPTSPTCQAFVSLERPGVYASRVQALSQWTLGAGILIAFGCTLLLPIGQMTLQLVSTARSRRTR